MTSVSILCTTAVLGLFTACANSSIPQARGAEAQPVDLQRSEYPLSSPWRALHDEDVIYPADIFITAVTTPSSMPQIDVVVTVTIDHRISPGDTGTIFASHSQGDAPPVQMIPRAGYPLFSPSGQHPSTSMFSWITRGLPGAGRVYEFVVSVSPLDGSGDHQAVIAGSRGVLVVEIAVADQ